MTDTPRVEAVVGGHGPIPANEMHRLAPIYSDLLQLARQLERELAKYRAEAAQVSSR